MLLAFTRGVEVESACRRLLPHRLSSVERRLHRLCLDSVLAAGRNAGCSIAVSSPRPLTLPADVALLPQEESGLGRRVRAALRRALGSHDGPVVLAGTDVPGLASRHLRAAIDQLRRDPDAVVLGPSPDGGFYLLATLHPLDKALAEVRWCSHHALASLVAALDRRGIAVRFLEPLQDLDRPQDLAGWVSRSGISGAKTGTATEGAMTVAWSQLRFLLRRILAELRRLAVPVALGRPTLAVAGVCAGRSPPLSVGLRLASVS